MKIDDKLVKAYYLRAIAHSKTHDYESGIEDIKQAIKLSPSDKLLRDEFENIKSLKQKHLQSQQQSMKSFFSGGLYQDKPVPQQKAGLP